MHPLRHLETRALSFTALHTPSFSPLLQRAMGVAQHHDAISGTAMQVVNDDYTKILSIGRADAFDLLSSAFASATGYKGAPFSTCELANATVCPSLESGAPTVLLAYNSLGQAAPSAPVRVSVGFPAGVASYAVYDAKGVPVTAQLIPLSKRDSDLRTLYKGSNTRVQVRDMADITAFLDSAQFSHPPSQKSHPLIIVTLPILVTLSPHHHPPTHPHTHARSGSPSLAHCPRPVSPPSSSSHLRRRPTRRTRTQARCAQASATPPSRTDAFPSQCPRLRAG